MYHRISVCVFFFRYLGQKKVVCNMPKEFFRVGRDWTSFFLLLFSEGQKPRQRKKALTFGSIFHKRSEHIVQLFFGYFPKSEKKSLRVGGVWLWSVGLQEIYNFFFFWPNEWKSLSECREMTNTHFRWTKLKHAFLLTFF